ncbi:MAG: NusG domain II-containing protein [Defluviitaleaceae bacterium]|nr:NusG domain II-containing protein [Defluviitaleaceae bacterium]
MRKIVSKKDIFFILGVILLAVVFFIWQSIRTTGLVNIHAAIQLNGETVKTINLDTDTDFYVEERPNVRFRIQEGLVAFVCSDCLDQICVNAGFLGRVGQMAACLPNGLVMIIRGDTPDDNIDLFLQEENIYYTLS